MVITTAHIAAQTCEVKKMTKEQMEKEIKRLENELRKEQEKVEALENHRFYEGQVERCRLYDEIFDFVKHCLDRGGEIILRPRD